MTQVLIKDKKYTGKFVAIKNARKPVIVSSGKDPQSVYKKALRCGCSEPVIFFVPEKNAGQTYSFGFL
ncbi:MAG: DUF5678 domain-containing protein [Candidatus Omnitrophica bacterium]|nr:DUF5678 domain-containing protein [Candidatus Omnitrophota bacterium]